MYPHKRTELYMFMRNAEDVSAWLEVKSGDEHTVSALRSTSCSALPGLVREAAQLLNVL